MKTEIESHLQELGYVVMAVTGVKLRWEWNGDEGWLIVKATCGEFIAQSVISYESAHGVKPLRVIKDHINYMIKKSVTELKEYVEQ